MKGEDNFHLINCPRGFCHSYTNKNNYDGTKEFYKNCYIKEEDPLTYWRGLKAETNGTKRKINNCYSHTFEYLKIDTEECLCDLNYCNAATQKVRKFLILLKCTIKG